MAACVHILCVCVWGASLPSLSLSHFSVFFFSLSLSPLSRCPPGEYHRLLENVVKKQGVFHQTDKGTGEGEEGGRGGGKRREGGGEEGGEGERKEERERREEREERVRV